MDQLEQNFKRMQLMKQETQMIIKNRDQRDRKRINWDAEMGNTFHGIAWNEQ